MASARSPLNSFSDDDDSDDVASDTPLLQDEEWTEYCNADLYERPRTRGICNTGQSCYMNAALQFTFAIPQLHHLYLERAEELLQHSSQSQREFNQAIVDFAKELYKSESTNCTSHGAQKRLCNGGVRPDAFQQFVASRGKPEFSGYTQQDSLEYFLHLTTLIKENFSVSGEENPCESFRLKLSEKIERGEDTTYTTREEYVLSCPIPKPENIGPEGWSDEELFRRLICCRMVSNCVVIYAFIAFFLAVSHFAADAEKGEQDILETCLPIAVFITALTCAAIYLLNSESGTTMTIKTHVMLMLVTFLLLFLTLAVALPIRIWGSRHIVRLSLVIWSLIIPCLYIGAILYSRLWRVSLMDCVGRFMRREPVQSLQSSVYKQSRILKFPPYIILQPRKFVIENGQSIKLNDVQLDVKETIDLREFSARAQVTDGEASGISKDPPVTGYTLVAFVTHTGRTPRSGHYVCHVKREEIWLCYDDVTVTQVNNPPTSNGYYFLYKRLDFDEKRIHGAWKDDAGEQHPEETYMSMDSHQTAEENQKKEQHPTHLEAAQPTDHPYDNIDYPKRLTPYPGKNNDEREANVMSQTPHYRAESQKEDTILHDPSQHQVTHGEEDIYTTMNPLETGRTLPDD